MTQPLIGITGRRQPGSIIDAPAGFLDTPLDLYMAEYATSVIDSGGLPVYLPLDAPPEGLAGRLDALIVSGGEDVDPRRYGGIPGPHTPTVSRLRDEFEERCILAAIERGVPVLGICRGHQILNVALGGTLVPHLAPGDGESHSSYAYHRADRVHRVSVTGGTELAGVYGAETVVNSFHHQAVDTLGERLVVAARADDGVVEAIELPGKPVLGVQWHPETFGGDPIFDWLVNAAIQQRDRLQEWQCDTTAGTSSSPAPALA